MFLPTVMNSMNNALKEQFVNEILQMNEQTSKYGLVLSAEETAQLLESRNRCLQQLGRVELGIDVSKSIIQSFCSSTYIKPEEYASTLNELQEVFYFMKNETEDKIGDTELIRIMKDYFENNCGGSLEFLKSELQVFAEDFRKKNGQICLKPKEDLG